MSDTGKKVLLLYMHNFEARDMGENIRIYNIADVLHKNGYSIDLYALSGMAYDFSNFDETKTVVDNLYLYPFSEVDKTEREDRLNSYVTPRMQEEFRNIVSENDYDFIAAVYLTQADLFKYFNSVKCKKIYFFEDDIAVAEHYNGKKIGGLIGDQISKLQYFDDVVCISNDEKLYYEKLVPNMRFHTVYGFLNISDFPESKKFSTDIIFVGHDNKFNIEGMHWFFDKVYGLLDENVKIKIIGKISKHINSRHKNVKLVGFVDNLEKEYVNAKISICPLLHGTGLKIKVIEAMGYGKACVVTSRGSDGFADKNEFGGLVTDDAVEFAGYINRLLTDEKFYEETVVKTKKYYDKCLSYNINSSKLLQIFTPSDNRDIIRTVASASPLVNSKNVKIRILCHLFAPNNMKQTAIVSVAGIKIGEIQEGDKEFVCSIPSDLIASDGRLNLEFFIDSPLKPCDIGSPDTRELGIFIEKIYMQVPSYTEHMMDFGSAGKSSYIKGFTNSALGGRWSISKKASCSLQISELKVSIIIVCKGNLKLEERAINSAMEQTYKNIEIIITDISVKSSIKKFVGFFPSKVERYETFPGLGYNEALNRVLVTTSGSYLLILDGSECLAPNAVTEFIDKILSTCADYAVSDGYCANTFCTPIPAAPIGESGIFSLAPSSLSGMCFSATVFNTIGLFREDLSFAASVEFQLRVVTNILFKGVKAGTLPLYYSEEPYILKPSKELVVELVDILKKYHPGRNEREIHSLIEFILFGNIYGDISTHVTNFYHDSDYSKTQRDYLKSYAETKGLRLGVSFQEIIDDKWYRFGKLSRKDKIKKIVSVFMKKLFPKPPKQVDLISNRGTPPEMIREHDKINLLYDVTYLSNGTMPGANRTGIFFVANNLLKNFAKNENLKVYLYCASENIVNAREFLRSEFFNDGKITFLNEWGDSVLDDTLKNIDVFFSPIYQIPKKIAGNGKIIKFSVLHDTLPFIYPDFFPDMKHEDYWFKNLINSINTRDYYFPVSNCTKNDFLKFSKMDSEHAFVAYNGVADNFSYCGDSNVIDSVKKKYSIPRDKKYILSLCTVEPRKNLIFAIKGFIEFINKNNIDDIVFVMGGTQWHFFMEQFNKEVLNSANYQNKIIRAGYISDEDLSVLYSGSFMFVYPSLYEGFGMPPLEAMKCGVPVIVSNRSSLPEVVGDAGLTINPENLNELVAGIEKLYFDEVFRKTLAIKGKARADNLFSWEKTTNLMIEKIMAICQVEKVKSK